MIVFNIIMKCHMVVVNMDHYLYLKKNDQEKKDILL